MHSRNEIKISILVSRKILNLNNYEIENVIDKMFAQIALYSKFNSTTACKNVYHMTNLNKTFNTFEFNRRF